jgi:iron complex outermembrane receptor protein
MFARAGTSFRVASVDDNGQTSTGQLLEPQTASHRDVGIEYTPPGLRLRASYYRIDLENEIYFSPLAFAAGAFFPGANVNLSPTRRTGVELSGSWFATQNLELSGYLNLQTAKFRTGTYGGVDVSGRDVPLVPRSLAALKASWRATQATKVNGALRFVGRQRYDNDQANQFPRLMPAYALADLNLSYETGAWRFTGGVRNLFDKKYFSYGIINNFTCTTPSCVYPEAGRTVFAGAEYRLQ